MTRLLLVIAIALLPAVAYAQSAPYGLTSASLGGSGSARPGDPWASLNPASLASLQQPTAAMYLTQAFGMPELRFGAGALAHPVGAVTAGIRASSFGDSDFRETDFSLTAARRLVSGTNRFNVGFAAAIRQISIAEYETTHLLYFSIGWQAEAMPGLMLGGALHNVTRTGWNDVDIVPRRMNVGIVYSPVSDVTVVADLLKYDDWPLAAGGGLEIELVPAFAVRAGAASGPDRLTIGARLSIGGITAEVLAERHVDLGWSPGIGLATSW
jgi:hypothetical protein